MYGVIPAKQTTVTMAPKNLLLPYRREMKSAILEILLTREMRMIFFKIIIQAGIIIIGQIYIGKYPKPELAATPILP